MDYIKEWATSPSLIGFGHAKCSYSSLSDLDTWKEVVEGVCQRGPAQVLVVGPTMKTKIATLAWHDLQNSNKNLENELETLTYRNFLKRLRANRAQDGTGPEAWRYGQDSKAQTVVVVLDHDMGAACALAMLAAVHWATDIGKIVPVRVLTVSFSSAPDAFRRLLDLYAHNQPYLFEVNKCAEISEAQLSSVEQIGWVGFNDTLVESLKESLQGQAKRQIIICPSMEDCMQILPVQQDGRFRERTVTEEAMEDRLAILERLPIGNRAINESEDSEVRLERIVADDDNNSILRYQPGDRPPLPLDGFLHVHLYLTSHRNQIRFDDVTLRVAQMKLPVSHEERYEQLSLAFRASPIPEGISIYLEEETVDEFLDEGPTEKPLKVCNQHVGGFITALVCLLNWGIRFDRVVSCFFASDSQRLASAHTIDVLRCQEITSHILHDEDQTLEVFQSFPTKLGDQLVESTSLLLDLLPIVDFDYRLAAFVARHTLSDAVLKAKLQLAAILVTGIDQVLIHREPTEELYPQSLFNSCRGWTTSLANKGSMWIAVGLWKHSTLIVDEVVKNDSNAYEFRIPGTGVAVNIPASRRVQKTITSLANTLITNYTAVLPDDIPEFPLTEEGCDEIQEHLAYAYYNHTATISLDANGHLLYQLKDGPAGVTSVSIPRCLIDSTHFQRLFIENHGLPHDATVHSDSKIYGVYHGLGREFDTGNICLDDWTQIPSKFVLGLNYFSS
ncbi:hypothetical protein ACHAPI_011799 [Fusarium lateritium]